MKTVSFNTGRKYTARGQVIVATLHDDGVITFMDHSRMISGEIAASEFHTAESVERHTMRAYDNYAYQESRRSRADGMMRGGCNTEEEFEAQAAKAEAAAAAQAETAANVELASVTQTLANKFCEIVGEYFAHDELSEINRRNTTPAYSGACATQDFCDANLLMHQAFVEILGRDVDPSADTDCNLWNAAWNIAKAKGFKAPAAPAAVSAGFYWFEFDGQLVEPFDTLADAQAVCDEQVEFWLAQNNATREQELGWGDLSDNAIRNACVVSFAASK